MSIPLKSRNLINFSAPSKNRFLFKPIIFGYYYYCCCCCCCYYYYYYYCYYYYYHYFYLNHESGFLSHFYITVNRLFTPVKKFNCKRDMSKQSAVQNQNQQKKHKKRRWNRPKVNNADTRAISLTLPCYHHHQPHTISHPAAVSTFRLKGVVITCYNIITVHNIT